jgi:NADH-quinone oxidoreductase subunit C
MKEQLQPIVSALAERFGAAIQEFRGAVVLNLSAEQIVPACQTLRDEFGFDFLEEETAVDYWPAQDPRFHIAYQIYSIGKHLRIGIRVPISALSPILPSLEGVYPNANWFEREIWDMFGVRFEGHSDLRRILMPYDWQGHPLRKDYPLGYEEVQFTFNAQEIDQDKPYAQE